MQCLLIDLDGVLCEGDQPVAGAADVLAWLDDQAIPRMFLTNTTSRPRSAVAEKLAGMGMSVAAADIMAPPVAAAHWLRSHVTEPVALFVPPATVTEFAGIRLAEPGSSAPAGAVVIGDDIRTDIDASQALGIRGVLVKTGKFRRADLDIDIRPYASLQSIAALPDWWRDETSEAQDDGHARM